MNKDGVSKNYSAVYWNLLQYGSETHAYWFPNDMSASSGYTGYQIKLDTLTKRVGFDPRQLPGIN